MDERTSLDGTNLEPQVEYLHRAEGQLCPAAPFGTAVLPAPPHAASRRQGETLLLFFEWTGEWTGTGAQRLYLEVRETTLQVYWRCGRSVTEALRRALLVANSRLYERNLKSPPEEHAFAGMTLVAWRGQDCFIGQAGPACVYGRCGAFFDRFPSTERPLLSLGSAPAVDVAVGYLHLTENCTLIVGPGELPRQIPTRVIGPTLGLASLAEVLGGLLRASDGQDLSAMVVRAVPATPRPAEEPVQEQPSAGQRLRKMLARRPRSVPPTRSSRSSEGASPAQNFPTQEIPARLVPISTATAEEPACDEVEDEVEAEVEGETVITRWSTAGQREEAPEAAEWTGTPVESVPWSPADRPNTLPDGASEDVPDLPVPGRTLWERLPMARVWAQLQGTLGALATVGSRGVHTVAHAGSRQARTLGRAMLPGPAPNERPARPPRPIPTENRALTMALSLSLPVLATIVVVAIYISHGTQARYESLLRGARDEISLAQSLDDDSVHAEQSRYHWEEALDLLNAALALQPGDSDATMLRADVMAALDQATGAVRLSPRLLADLGTVSPHVQLVVRGPAMFVLDTEESWLAPFTLIPMQEPLRAEGGERLTNAAMGRMVDMAWVDPSGGRLSEGLFVLGLGQALAHYEPGWQDLSDVTLGAPYGSNPRAMASYDGRLYVIDGTANQIWRYIPHRDAYETVEPYFENGAGLSLTTVSDVVASSGLYVLFADGSLRKFYAGAPAEFELRGVPGDSLQVSAVALAQEGDAETLYLADRLNARVVQVDSSGRFLAQYTADGDAFSGVQALAVDALTKHLFVASLGKLYTVRLP